MDNELLLALLVAAWAVGSTVARGAETPTAPEVPDPNTGLSVNAIQQGVIEEDINVDAEAAIAAYRQVIDHFDQQRAEAAQALFRLGEVLRKQGDLDEARHQYARIVREFSDQANLAAEGARQLAVLDQRASSPVGSAYSMRLKGIVAPRARPDLLVTDENRRDPQLPARRYRWLLNVAFGSSLTKKGPAAIGNTPQDYWNGYYLPWIKVVPLVNLKLWDGTMTDIGLVVSNAAGTWNNSTGDPMYDAYVYVNDGSAEPITVTVTNLPAGRYDFYLYGHADPDTQEEGNSLFTLSTGGQHIGPLGTIRSAGWRATQLWESGKQYVRFTGVEVTADEPVVVTVEAGQDSKPVDARNRPPVINGMQIVRKETAGILELTELETAPPPPIWTHSSPQPASDRARQAEATSRQKAIEDAWRRLEDILRSQLQKELENQMDEAGQAAAAARQELGMASRAIQLVRDFQSKPGLLPKPASADPRYQKLKEQLDEARLSTTNTAKQVDQASERISRWLQAVYLPELEAQQVAAKREYEEAQKRLEEAKDLLSKAQERLKVELANSRGEPQPR